MTTAMGMGASEPAEKRGRGRARSSKQEFLPSLDARLKELNTSLYVLAKQTGVSYTTLYNVFTGRNEPGFRLATKLAHALGWSLDYFSVKYFTENPLAEHSKFGNNSGHQTTPLNTNYADVA